MKILVTCHAGDDLEGIFVKRYPYVIFYRITLDAVELLRVRHGAREPLIFDD